MPTEKETLYIAFSTQKEWGGQDDPDGAGGQLPALRERAERGGGGLRLSAAQHRRMKARLENRQRRTNTTRRWPTANCNVSARRPTRSSRGTAEDAGKGGRTIGEAARHGHRVLRPARHGKQRRCAADAGEHGLHFLAHRGRPGGDGKHTAFRHQAEGHANGHGQDEHQGAVPAVEHVDGREKSELYGVYEEIIRELELQVLQTFPARQQALPARATEEHKAVFRSTLFPVDGTLAKGSYIREITEEILTIIGR